MSYFIFQTVEKVIEKDETYVNKPKSKNVISQSFNPSSFLFGDKSSGNLFEKTPNAPIFGNFTTDSIKTDDTKSTSLFSQSSSTISFSPTLGKFSAGSLFTSLGSTESQTATQSSLFSKTDDTKSKIESTFSFSPKSNSPFKFGIMSKEPTSAFGQSLFGIKDKSVNGDSPKGIYVKYIFV